MTKKQERKTIGRPPEIGVTRDCYVMAKCTQEERDRWNQGAREKKSTIAKVVREYLNKVFR